MYLNESDPIAVANELVRAGRRSKAVVLLRGALINEPHREGISQRLHDLQWELWPEKMKEEESSQRRTLAERAFREKRERKLSKGLRTRQVLFGAAVLLMKLDSKFELTAHFSTLLFASSIVAFLFQYWRLRLPLRYRGSGLSHEDHRLSYHLCTFALLGFAAMLSVSSGVLFGKLLWRELARVLT
jgi:hypothetical protein